MHFHEQVVSGDRKIFILLLTEEILPVVHGQPLLVNMPMEHHPQAGLIMMAETSLGDQKITPDESYLLAHGQGMMEILSFELDEKDALRLAAGTAFVMDESSFAPDTAFWIYTGPDFKSMLERLAADGHVVVPNDFQTLTPNYVRSEPSDTAPVVVDEVATSFPG